jgi:DNA mismatch repair protein MutS
VARLAGMPAQVIARAKEILARLEGSQDDGGENFKPRGRATPEQPAQMGLFSPLEDRFRDRLSKLDVSHMTPMEAMIALHELTEEAKK